MNSNVQEVFTKIFKDDELLTKFMNIDDIDEMYEFCLEIEGGHTKSEFEEFLVDLLGECSMLIGGSGRTDLDSELDMVSGGVGAFKKAIASTLAVASVFSASGVGAADTGGSNSNGGYISFAEEESKDSSGGTEESTEKGKKGGVKAFGERLKNGFSNLVSWAKNNKGKVVLGTAITAAVAAALVAGGTYATVKIVKHIENKGDLPDHVTKAEYNAEINNLKRILSHTTDINEKRNLQNEIEELKKERDGIGFLHRASDKLKTFGPLATVAAGGVTGLGLLANAVGKMFSTFRKGTNELGGFAKDVKNIFGLVETTEKIVRTAKLNGEMMLQKFDLDHKDYDLNKRRESFFSFLDNEVKGQKEAKEKIKQVFDKIKFEREAGEKVKLDKPRPNLVIFNGTSGIGKTMCAEEFARAIAPNPDKILEISGPTAIKNLDDPTKMAEELFGVNKYTFYTEDAKNNLGRYIIQNPEGVVIINEYDKIGGKETVTGAYTDTNHPLDETLRELTDNSTFVNPITGDKIDCSKITFILTTNEANSSLKIPDDPMGDNYTSTHPQHDGSFLSRCEVIPFKSFSEAEYKEITEQNTKTWLGFFSTDVGGAYRFKLADNIYDKVVHFVYHGDRTNYSLNTYDSDDDDSQDIFERDTSARFIQRLAKNMAGQIATLNVNKRDEVLKKLAEDTGKNVSEIKDRVPDISGSKVDLDFDESKGCFVVSCNDYGNYSDSNYQNLLEQLKKNLPSNK